MLIAPLIEACSYSRAPKTVVKALPICSKSRFSVIPSVKFHKSVKCSKHTKLRKHCLIFIWYPQQIKQSMLNFNFSAYSKFWQYFFTILFVNFDKKNNGKLASNIWTVSNASEIFNIYIPCYFDNKATIREILNI